MASSSDLENLRLYCQLGFSIIPIKAGQKTPQVDWKKYQQETASYEQVLEWSENFPDCNWAVVTGKVSNVMVVDCDNDEAFQTAKALEITSSAAVKTPHGWHFYFRLPNDGKERKTISGHGSKGTYWPKVAGLDLRYEGGYALIPPSVNYEWEIEEETIEDELTIYPDWQGARYEDDIQPDLIPSPAINNFSDLDLTNTSTEGAGKTQNETEKKYAEIAEQYQDGKIPRGGSGIHDATYRFMAEQALLVGIGPELAAAGQKFMTDNFATPLTDGRFETSLKNVRAQERQNHPERFDANGNYTYHQSTKGVTPNTQNIMNQVSQPSQKTPLLYSDDGEAYADGEDIECWQYPWLPKASIIQVYGYSGHGKSMFLEHALHHAALGLNFGPFGSNGKPRVLYLDFENGRTTWGRRIAMMTKSIGNPKENLFYWTPWLNNETMNLREPEGLIKLQKLILETNPDIIVIDTLRSAFPGLKENSPEEWTAINQMSMQIRNTGRTVILVHHANKPGQDGGLGREAGSANQLTVLETQLRVCQVYENADIAKSKAAICASDLESNPFKYMRKQMPRHSSLGMVFELSYGKVREWTDLHEHKQYIGLATRPDGRTWICNSESPINKLKRLITNHEPKDMIIGKMDRPLEVLEKWAAEIGMNFPKK